jgi:CHAT domain-containing protein
VRPLVQCVWRFLVVVLLCAMSGAAQTTSTDEALQRAKALYSQEGAKAALPEFEAVLDSDRQSGNKRGEAIVTGLIANCYKKLGDYPRALAMLNSALQMKRELHDRLEEGKTLGHLGLVYWEQGKYDQAIAFFNQSLSIAQELNDAQLEGASLNNLSLVYEEQGDYRRSFEQYQRALALHRSVNYEPGVSDALGNIGGHYLLLGRYTEAEGYYRQALEISERLGLKPSESQDLGNIASCLLGQGKVSEALSTYDQAIKLALDAGQAKEQADWYRGKASALLRVGKFDEALRNYRFATETYTKAGMKRELVENLGDIGNAYLELGDHQGAEKSFLKAASISKAIGHERGVVANQMALAEVSRISGEYARAKKNATFALVGALNLDDTAETIRGLLLIARISRNLNQLSSALKSADEAGQLAKRDGLLLLEAEALDESGELKLRLRRPQDALEDMQTAWEVAKQSGDTSLFWRVEYHRGQAFERLHQYHDALQAYQASVDSIESVRSQISEQGFRTGYLQDKQRVYIALVHLLLRLGKANDAFAFSEQLREYSYQTLRNRSFTIESSPAVMEAKSRMAHLQELVLNESSRQRRGQALQLFSAELSGAQRDFELAIDKSPQPANLGTQASLAKIRDALPPDAALIEYVVADDVLAIFVLRRSGLQTITQPITERNLHSKVELFRALLAEKDNERWRKPAASLYSALISPPEKKGFLRGIRSLVIVPHGILNYLPFAALPNNGEKDSHFLIETYDVVEEPAATFLVSSPSSHTGALRRVGSFAPASAGLRYAMPEAREVAGIFGTRGEAIVGRNATKARFEAGAPNYDVVHVATHGFFNKANPMLSGLQFEPESSDDGRLEVHDILTMRLSARLVTLSACDTALGGGSYGEIPAGDEFVGLSRAFLEIGSDAVIASLWKVDDRSTTPMMRSIYRQIESNGASEALALAQRAMIRNPRYSDPYYWAAFVYFGRNFSTALSAENH